MSHVVLDTLMSYPHTEESFFAILQFNLYSETLFPEGMNYVNRSLFAERRLTRYVNWSLKCPSGRIRNAVCILGVPDLPFILKNGYWKVLFANKFLWDFWDCMQAWYYAKMQEYRTSKLAFNASEYMSRPCFMHVVREQNWALKKFLYACWFYKLSFCESKFYFAKIAYQLGDNVSLDSLVIWFSIKYFHVLSVYMRTIHPHVAHEW